MSEHHHHHEHHSHDHANTGDQLFQNSLIHYSIQRGLIYKFLFTSALFATAILIIAVLLPLHRLFKKLFSKLFNIKFNFKGMDLTIYSLILIWIFFCFGLFTFIKMQTAQFSTIYPHESLSSKMQKHKNKCMLESELWMLAIIMIEWATIFKYFKLLDYRIHKEEELRQLKEATDKKQ